MTDRSSPEAAWHDSGDPDVPLLIVVHGPLRAVFVPGVGGRLIGLAYEGHEFLWSDPDLLDPTTLRWRRPPAQWPVPDGSFASWANVGGSKTWPAPQGWNGPDEWAGPPDPVLDRGAYAAEVANHGDTREVTLTSADDPRTGLRIERRFTFGASSAVGFEQRIRFTNTSDRSRRWAIWEVAQLATADARGGRVEVPLVGGRTAPDLSPSLSEPEPEILDLGRYAGEPRVRLQHDPVSGQRRAVLPIVSGIAKFGFPTAAGVLHWFDPSAARLSIETAVDERAVYPDGGSRVELWTQSPADSPILDGWQPQAWLVELELLGPLTTLEPGAISEQTLTWSVA